MRPVFMGVFVPSCVNEDRISTGGSWRIIFASAAGGSFSGFGGGDGVGPSPGRKLLLRLGHS